MNTWILYSHVSLVVEYAQSRGMGCLRPSSGYLVREWEDLASELVDRDILVKDGEISTKVSP